MFSAANQICFSSSNAKHADVLCCKQSTSLTAAMAAFLICVLAYATEVQSPQIALFVVVVEAKRGMTDLIGGFVEKTAWVDDSFISSNKALCRKKSLAF